MQAYLLISANATWLQQTTLSQAQQAGRGGEYEQLLVNPDTIVVQAPKAIGVDSIRQFTQDGSRKPYQEPQTIAIIDATTGITPEAQNALLKTLEEPPGETTIIIWAAPNQEMLQTIVSRCFVLVDDHSGSAKQSIDVAELEQMRIGERLVWAKQFGNDLSIVQGVVQALLAHYREQLHKANNPVVTQLLQQLLGLHHDLDKRVSPKFCLDIALLSLPKKVNRQFLI